MVEIAAHSLRRRRAGLLATFLAALLGATLTMAFASMLDTAAAGNVDASSRETLTNMGTIVGGWGLLIAVFSMSSTFGLRVRQRGHELALLRNVGATPAQTTRLLAFEALAVATAASLAAIAPGAAGGVLLLGLLQDTGQVSTSVSFAFGPVAVGLGVGVTVVAATAAALVSAYRSRHVGAADALREAAHEPGGMSRKRIAVAALFLLLGLDLAVVTATVFDGKGIDAMQTGGQASIWAAIGLAMLAPALLRRAAGAVERPLQRRAGVVGELALIHARKRSAAMGRILMPIIIFVGVAVGTLYLQAIESSQPFRSGGGITAGEAEDIQTLNFVVVGMLALFAGIMVINTSTAATADRRQEFARQRLAGLSRRQVRALVTAETVLVAGTGIVAGTLAAAFTVVPYNLARTGSLIPDVSVLPWLAVVAVAVTTALAPSVRAARIATRGSAVSAL